MVTSMFGCLENPEYRGSLALMKRTKDLPGFDVADGGVSSGLRPCRHHLSLADGPHHCAFPEHPGRGHTIHSALYARGRSR